MRRILLSIIALLGVIQTWGYNCKVNEICYNLNWSAHTASVTYSGYPYNNDYTGHYGGGLKNVDIVIPSIITYNDIDYTVTAIEDNAFYDSQSSVLMSSFTIPSTVTSIGYRAFWKCTNLTSFTIPSSVTTIGDYAFSGCWNLTTVIVEKEIPLSITSNTFSNSASATLYVPYGCKAAYEIADHWKDFKEIKETPPTSVDLSISDAGIGTYCSEYDLDFTNSEVKAYIFSAFTPSTGKVLLTRIYDVPANTGIVVKGDEGDFQIPTKSAETIVANMLVGVTEDTQLDKVVGDYTNYILAKKAGEIGFYAVSDGSTLKAHKAYLPLLTASLPSSSRVAVVFDDEEATTFINEVGPKDSGILNTVYNLNGQRLSGLQKGLNIINGKKVIIK